ncbi:MAG: M15 family metallopeptidase [Gammaproteobacteria bacterium]|nr:M15 family metallopeptidase [Gammaproteobacteria bacterium]
MTDRALDILKSEGTPFKIYSGLRTFKEQDSLYAKGRTTPGKVVTKAKGGDSLHNYGLAVDMAPLLDPDKPKGNVYWPDHDAPEWEDLEYAITEASRVAVDTEYEWGGRWRFRDLPHVQVRITLGELRSGVYPYSFDIEWLVSAHTSFLYNTPWINKRIQYLLNATGYKAGYVDGIVGNRTKAAAREFSHEFNLEFDYSCPKSKLLVECLVREARRIKADGGPLASLHGV